MTVVEQWRKRIQRASGQTLLDHTMIAYGAPFDAFNDDYDGAPINEESVDRVVQKAHELGVPCPRHISLISAYDDEEYHIGKSFLVQGAYIGTIRLGGIAPVPQRPDERWKILDGDDRFFTARVLVLEDGFSVPRWIPLQVQFLNPDYFLRRMAYILD